MKTDKRDVSFTQTEEERLLVEKIQDCYRASYAHKEGLGLHNLWSKEQDYWAGDNNPPEDEDDPASNTNVIQPIIESQVADLVDGTLEILAKPVGPSDAPFATIIMKILKWVWYHNKMTPKLDEGERDRLNLGTIGWMVYQDKDAMKGRGLPIMEPCGPDTLFPDPKVKNVRDIQDGDFFIRVKPCSLNMLIRRFGDRAKLVKAEGNFNSYDPRIFKDQKTAEGANAVINSQALLFEYWEKDEEGKLRRIYMAGKVILDDSDWTHKGEDDARESFYQHGKYPFVMIPCYNAKGRLWGRSDTEQLIPVQDMINDLDDQIRMNARLMGNVQMVVGISSGINLKKWTNTPGLKVPAKDHTAWQQVNPTTIPGYIVQRREAGFNESEIISGRSDVVEGRRSGSLRAASAILAMQEAGSRRALHKKLMLQEGFSEILSLVLEYVKEFMTAEQSFDITEGKNTEFTWFRGSNLKEIPWLTPNENFNPAETAPGTERYKQLVDPNTMQPVTKDIEVDVELSLGAGMPNNKSFIYQAVVELHRENLITQEEGRATLKEILNWPIIDPFNPVGQFAGRNNSAEQLAAANGQAATTQTPEQGQPTEGQPSGGNPQNIQEVMDSLGQLDPAFLQQALSMMGGQQPTQATPEQPSSSVNPDEIMAMLQQLDPKFMEEVMAKMGGAPNAGNLG